MRAVWIGDAMLMNGTYPRRASAATISLSISADRAFGVKALAAALLPKDGDQAPSA